MKNKQKKKKSFGIRLLKFIGGLILAVIVLAALLFGALTVAEYKPAPTETVATEGRSDSTVNTGKSLTVLTWNTGYGALGDNADFFMDGGKGVKTATQARLEENMKTMLDVTEEIDPDVIFLQETDRSSTRSSKVNETTLWKQRFTGYTSAFANNFKVSFVPYPVPPIGKVDSGLLTLSRFEMKDDTAERIALPCPFTWPLRIANLKRCLLVSRVELPDSGGKELVLVNLHLEAYDSGEGKIAQTNMLKEILSEEIEKGNYVIAGGDFNQTFSNIDSSAYPVYEGMWTPGVIDAADFDDSVQLLMDPSTPTCRSLDRPYEGEDPASFQFYMIDGFIVSSNLTVKRCITLDESFLATDHNPVLLEVSFPGAEENDGSDDLGGAAAFTGIWECDRASIEITPRGDGFHCLVHWGSSAFESTSWDYDCAFDGEALYSQENGTKINHVFSEDGGQETAETVFTDGAARFSINEKGNLIWEDFKENAADGMEFVYTSAMPGEGAAVPTADVLKSGYFDVIGGIETGTAGASLKMAQAACSVLQFAADNQLDLTDSEELRATLLAVWEDLSDEERAAFDGSFMDVVLFLDECEEDPAANEGTFEDAGIAEQMNALLSDPAALSSWGTLKAFTLTMGNSDGE